MRKIKLHPLFIVLGIVLALSSRFKLFLLSLIAVLLHEGAHFIAAKERGYALTGLRLMPYGAVLCGETDVEGKDLSFIAIAGPVGNVVVACCLTALWWLYPGSYYYTLDFVKVNVTIAVFNLLPCYPLDGARIIIGLVKNKLKALSFLRAAGIFISVILMALCLASAFFKVNYTFGIASIMLAYGAVGGTEKERYVHIYKELFFLKDLARPLEKSELFVCADVTLNALLKTLRSSKIYRINVVDGNMKTLFSLDNADLERLYMTCDRRLPLSQLSIFRNGKAASKETA